MDDDDPPFRVHRHGDADMAVVTPEGDIDLKTVDAIRAELVAAQAESRTVVFDLRGVTFIDSSGVRLIVEAQLASRDDGFALFVVRGPDPVERLFDLAGLHDRLTLIDDPSEAARGDDQDR